MLYQDYQDFPITKMHRISLRSCRYSIVMVVVRVIWAFLQMYLGFEVAYFRIGIKKVAVPYRNAA